MTVTIAESVVIVRPEWPKVTCPGAEGGIHRIRFDLGTWLCQGCEAEIANGDLAAVMRLWEWLHATLGLESRWN